MDEKRIILDFIQAHPIGVISTVNSDNKPQSAVVDLIMLENMEILFNTFIPSKKYKNLKNNPSVAIVVSDLEKKLVQYEGEARELEEMELKKYQGLYDQKTKWRVWKIKEFRYFIVSPKLISFSNFTDFPQKTFEIKF